MLGISVHEAFQSKPDSVSHSLAEHYLTDARDFAARFDHLWETETHKTGRIKTFVDLLMGCECALKAHIFLGRLNDDSKVVYKSLKTASHRIGTLADQATFLADRQEYDFLKNEMDSLSVTLRYSLDAYETFFPSYADRSDATINYSATIGNHPWVMGIRGSLEKLIDVAEQVCGGFVDMDFEANLVHERAMRDFWASVRSGR
jgi:hypothetical protein